LSLRQTVAAVDRERIRVERCGAGRLKAWNGHSDAAKPRLARRRPGARDGADARDGEAPRDAEAARDGEAARDPGILLDPEPARDPEDRGARAGCGGSPGSVRRGGSGCLSFI
jgi:hypothetical protein